MEQPDSSLIQSAEQRAWNYWFDDGLPTIVSGATALLIALCLILDSSKSTISLILSIVAFLLYTCFLFFSRKIVEWLKSKVTYPRTGYVRSPDLAKDAPASVDFVTLALRSSDAASQEGIQRLHDGRKRLAALALVMVLAGTLVAVLVKNPWASAYAGALVVAGFWIAARGSRLFLWIILIVFPFVGYYMIASSAERLTGPVRLAYFLAAGGVLFMLDGSITLLRYVRRNPGPKAPQQ